VGQRRDHRDHINRTAMARMMRVGRLRLLRRYTPRSTWDSEETIEII
jgi:hypothetical protein